MNCDVTKVTIFVPLESIGVVRCDFDGIYHIQIDDKEFVTDEETYWRGVSAHNILRDKEKVLDTMRRNGIFDSPIDQTNL